MRVYKTFCQKMGHLSVWYTKYTGYTVGVPGIRGYTRLVSEHLQQYLYIQSSVYRYTKIYEVYKGIQDIFSKNGTPFWPVYKVYGVYGRRFGYTRVYEKFPLKMQDISGRYTWYTGYTKGVPGIREYTRVYQTSVREFSIGCLSSEFGIRVYQGIRGIREYTRPFLKKWDTFLAGIQSIRGVQ